MKTIGFRALTLYIALVILLGGLFVLAYRLVNNGDKWVMQSYNGHIYSSSASVETGTITDINDVVLAYSQDGTRYYSSNLLIRTALLHTVGDNYSYISTGIQATNRAELVGYNIFTGLNTLPFDSFSGNDIQITVDSSLCAVAYDALDGLKGAVVMYNYLTGEILCKVSSPSYDPLDVPSDIETNSAYSGAYIDNTISSSYTPGSIFKLITTACAIENLEDWESIVYCCEKELYVDGGTVTCLGTHGDETIGEALGHSCNIYFAQLAIELGIEKLQATAEQLGFNQKFSLSDFTTTTSSIDLTNASDLDLAWAGVGQYTTSVNPMNMAILMGAIANSGTTASPYVIVGNGGDEIELLSSDTADILEDLMRDTVSDYYNSSVLEQYNICAKTGTAEVGGDTETTSWFVGFSQNSDTPYAFAVVVEEGGSGSSYAKSVVVSMFNELS